jgi:hypothetical protein
LALDPIQQSHCLFPQLLLLLSFLIPPILLDILTKFVHLHIHAFLLLLKIVDVDVYGSHPVLLARVLLPLIARVGLIVFKFAFIGRTFFFLLSLPLAEYFGLGLEFTGAYN